MKKLFTIASLLSLAACGEPDYITQFKEEKTYKVVLATKDAVETKTRMEYNIWKGDFYDIPYASTVYYVVYTDGTTEQITLAQFATLQKGDTVTQKKLVEYKVPNPKAQ